MRGRQAALMRLACSQERTALLQRAIGSNSGNFAIGRVPRCLSHATCSSFHAPSMEASGQAEWTFSRSRSRANGGTGKYFSSHCRLFRKCAWQAALRHDYDFGKRMPVFKERGCLQAMRCSCFGGLQTAAGTGILLGGRFCPAGERRFWARDNFRRKPSGWPGSLRELGS